MCIELTRPPPPQKKPKKQVILIEYKYTSTQPHSTMYVDEQGTFANFIQKVLPPQSVHTFKLQMCNTILGFNSDPV